MDFFARIFGYSFIYAVGFILSTGFVQLSAADIKIGEYQCEANGRFLRQANRRESLFVHSKFYFKQYKSRANRRVLKDLTGHVLINNPKVGQSAYYGSFSIEKLTSKRNYRPVKYIGFSKFEDFNAMRTNSTDGGDMYGYFVLEREVDENKLSAHYVFQAGNHMGGTIDYNCQLVN